MTMRGIPARLGTSRGYLIDIHSIRAKEINKFVTDIRNRFLPVGCVRAHHSLNSFRSIRLIVCYQLRISDIKVRDIEPISVVFRGLFLSKEIIGSPGLSSLVKNSTIDVWSYSNSHFLELLESFLKSISGREVFWVMSVKSTSLFSSTLLIVRAQFIPKSVPFIPVKS